MIIKRQKLRHSSGKMILETSIYCSLQPHTVTLHSLKPVFLSLAKWVSGNDLPDLFELLEWMYVCVWNFPGTGHKTGSKILLKKSANDLCKKNTENKCKKPRFIVNLF